MKTSKKGQHQILIVIPLLMIAMIVLVLTPLAFELIDARDAICNDRVGILKSVNGLTDKDTGFLSSGSTSTTTLLFEDGLLFTLNYRINKPLHLGKTTTYQECISPKGKISYRI